MTRARAAVLGLVMALAALGAGRAMQPAGELRETIYVFGTLVEIVTHGVPEGRARPALAQVAQDLQAQHRDWHAWRPGALTRLNAALASGQGAEVDPALAEVLAQGKELSCRSGGLFEPAIGALIGLWGFHQDTAPDGTLPDRGRIAQLTAANPRMTDLRLTQNRVSSANPAVQLDLGGFAKGAALDLAGRRLAALGIRDAVLNAGGDVNVYGRHGSRPWRVAIRNPFDWGAVAAVQLAPGEVLFTSGNYERFFEAGGLRFAHILDPRTGQPVQGVVSVSVLDTQGLRADAAATALAVAGQADWPQVAADMGVSAVLMITDDGRQLATPAMATRLEPVPGIALEPVQVVALPAARDPGC